MRKSEWSKQKLSSLEDANFGSLTEICPSDISGVGFSILTDTQRNLPAKLIVESNHDYLYEAVFSKGSDAESAISYLLGSYGGFSYGGVIPAEASDIVEFDNWSEIICA